MLFVRSNGRMVFAASVLRFGESVALPGAVSVWYSDTRCEFWYPDSDRLVAVVCPD
jgi:hypothetical protein